MNNLSENQRKYPPYSAGRISNIAVPQVLAELSIGEVIDYLKKHIHEFESVNYIYIVGKRGKLKGVISIKDILRQDRKLIIKKVMNTKLVKVHPFTHQEKVSYLALEHSIKAVPVVAKDGFFVGAVLNDTIISVLHHEMQKDLSNISGVPNFPSRDTSKLSLITLIYHRFPWLLFGLIGIIFSAKIIGSFESTLEENLILASFIPLIMYMGGSTLSQAQSFFIRDLAISPGFVFAKYFVKQLITTGLISFILSLACLGLNILLIGELWISFVISLALFLVLLMTTFTGLFIPYLFSRFKLDPADGSGPISTIIQDVLGVVVYFSIATLLL